MANQTATAESDTRWRRKVKAKAAEKRRDPKGCKCWRPLEPYPVDWKPEKGLDAHLVKFRCSHCRGFFFKVVHPEATRDRLSRYAEVA